jgi:hypothetical protein
MHGTGNVVTAKLAFLPHIHKCETFAAIHTVLNVLNGALANRAARVFHNFEKTRRMLGGHDQFSSEYR